MLPEADDQEPVTRRDPGFSAHAGGYPPTPRQLIAFVVDIAYREPSYALYSGTEKAYTGTFQVWASDEPTAVAEARARFEAAALTSGVGWARVITGVTCRRA